MKNSFLRNGVYQLHLCGGWVSFSFKTQLTALCKTNKGYKPCLCPAASTGLFLTRHRCWCPSDGCKFVVSEDSRKKTANIYLCTDCSANHAHKGTATQCENSIELHLVARGAGMMGNWCLYKTRPQSMIIAQYMSVHGCRFGENVYQGRCAARKCSPTALQVLEAGSIS